MSSVDCYTLMTGPSFEDKLVKEFTNISNNEAYKLAFNDRVLRRSNDGKSFVGNDQREHFMPLLIDTIKDKKAIFDVGAGAGEFLDEVHSYVQQATFYLEEPNSVLLNQYKERLQQYNFPLGGADERTIQEYLKGDNKMDPVDCILCTHMIYHLTDFTSKKIQPKEDLIDFITGLYDQLRDEGCIFLVYADLETAYAGKIALSYFETLEQTHYHSNLSKLYKARNDLLRDQGALSVLQSLHPNDSITMESHLFPSRFYGDSIADLAAMSLVGELIESSEKTFEIQKLKHAIHVLNQPNNGIQLLKEGMWSANEEQVVCIIRKIPPKESMLNWP
ncbi:hypothetical protein K7432_015902 [Basidiobolus ranarum]|uniref:Methyltransferase type 12 domain-containing protein n=1 Tax=Basidiobolus ranarum TaxID=34480 RepID=A0ABR2WFK5_9FUNG